MFKIIGNIFLYLDIFECDAIKNSKILYITGKHVFFGYYDITPFSFDDTKILALATDSTLVSPKKAAIDIGYFESTDKNGWRFKRIGESLTWCWQQGCRLQWYHRSGVNGNDAVFYNTFINNNYVGMIQKLTGEIVTIIPIAIYDLSSCGRYGLSLNFSRLQRLRPGYGYSVLPDHTEHENIPVDDGVFHVDIEQGAFKKILSYQDIVKHIADKDVNEFDHYINHLSFNPSSNMFMFLYLLTNKKARKSFLFTCKPDGSGLRLINDSGKVSHYTWKDDNSLLVFCQEGRNTKMSYVLYDLKSEAGSRLAEDILCWDGHPTFLNDGVSLLSDTYPDYFGYQSLYIFDTERQDFKLSCKLFRSKKFSKEFRTDLHPRINKNNTLICVDDEYHGRKAMRLIEVLDVIA